MDKTIHIELETKPINTYAENCNKILKSKQDNLQFYIVCSKTSKQRIQTENQEQVENEAEFQILSDRWKKNIKEEPGWVEIGGRRR